MTRWFAAVLSAPLLSCTGITPAPIDTDLPEDTDEETEILDDTGEFFPDDTSTPVFDEVPENFIILRQEGSWNLAPLGGPYTSMTGSLMATESGDFELEDTAMIVDTAPVTDTGGPTIVCRVEYALTGLPPADGHSCASCAFVFDVEFTVVDGSPGLCNDPDIPTDGSVKRMGYDSASGAILYDYYGSGVWIPWYSASQIADLVSFEWETTVAFTLPEAN